MHNTHAHSDRHITYTSHSPALRCMLTHSPLALWVVYLPLHLHSGPLSLPTTSLPHCVLSSKASSSAPAFPQPQVSPRDGMCKSRAQETLKGLCPVPRGWRGLSDLGGGHHCLRLSLTSQGQCPRPPSQDCWGMKGAAVCRLAPAVPRAAPLLCPLYWALLLRSSITMEKRKQSLKALDIT